MRTIKRKKLPTVPAYLSTDAKNEWRKIVSELDEIGTLAIVDRASLVLYIEAWQRYNDHQNEPLTMVSPNGVAMISPAYQIIKHEREVMRRFYESFGLSPMSRAKLDIEVQAGKDDFTQFLFGNN